MGSDDDDEIRPVSKRRKMMKTAKTPKKGVKKATKKNSKIIKNRQMIDSDSEPDVEAEKIDSPVKREEVLTHDNSIEKNGNVKKKELITNHSIASPTFEREVTEINDIDPEITSSLSFVSTSARLNVPLHKNQPLDWNHRVNLIGEKCHSPRIHICENCKLPILVYGRMIPCKHVFCYACAKSNETTCLRCEYKAVRVEKNGLGAVFMCTYDQCGRTYLSQRDLQAHVQHRHMRRSAPTHNVHTNSLVAAAQLHLSQLRNHPTNPLLAAKTQFGLSTNSSAENSTLANQISAVAAAAFMSQQNRGQWPMTLSQLQAANNIFVTPTSLHPLTSLVSGIQPPLRLSFDSKNLTSPSTTNSSANSSTHWSLPTLPHNHPAFTRPFFP